MWAKQHRYILAADDTHVRRSRRREVPGLPIMHYSQSVLVLEPMSDLTERDIWQREQGKSALSVHEQHILQHMDSAPPPAPPPPKRKRAKEPNPLSVKKKKTPQKLKEGQATSPAPAPALDTKRRRNKKRGSGGSTVQ